jgi:uncharacterized membrane protein YedE/YeeE
MDNVLQTRPSAFVLGPLIGLVVLGLAAALGHRIGAVGGYSAVLERSTGRARSLSWKAWFLFGILGGSLLFRLLAGRSDVGSGFGWLTRELDGPVVAIALVIGGALIGFGAKTAGGCTSGNGLSGVSMTSVAAIAATATFFATAIAVSFVIKGLT